MFKKIAFLIAVAILLAVPLPACTGQNLTSPHTRRLRDL